MVVEQINKTANYKMFIVSESVSSMKYSQGKSLRFEGSKIVKFYFYVFLLLSSFILVSKDVVQRITLC